MLDSEQNIFITISWCLLAYFHIFLLGHEHCIPEGTVSSIAKKINCICYLPAVFTIREKHIVLFCFLAVINFKARKHNT